jgi:hypothetical protein
LSSRELGYHRRPGSTAASYAREQPSDWRLGEGTKTPTAGAMGLAFVVSVIVEEALGSTGMVLKYSISTLVGGAVFYATRKWLRDLRDGG